MSAPIDMVLHCPACGLQHIDVSEYEADLGMGNTKRTSEVWTNPPHRSHLCHGCGHIWRPADVPTNGVAEVKTRGKNDSPLRLKARTQPCIGADPLCPCRDGDSCHYAGKDAWPVPPQPAADPAHGYALSLATTLWEKHYKIKAPHWEPCDDTLGLLTQIDNMVAGITRAKAPSAVPDSNWCSYCGDHFRETKPARTQWKATVSSVSDYPFLENDRDEAFQLVGASPSRAAQIAAMLSRRADPNAPASATRAKAASLPCGHPASLMLKSAETGADLYCECCDAQSRARDAEGRELTLTADLDTLRARCEAAEKGLADLGINGSHCGTHGTSGT